MVWLNPESTVVSTKIRSSSLLSIYSQETNNGSHYPYPPPHWTTLGNNNVTLFSILLSTMDLTPRKIVLKFEVAQFPWNFHQINIAAYYNDSRLISHKIKLLCQ